jgi:hypothetical protein
MHDARAVKDRAVEGCPRRNLPVSALALAAALPSPTGVECVAGGAPRPWPCPAGGSHHPAVDWHESSVSLYQLQHSVAPQHPL